MNETPLNDLSYSAVANAMKRSECDGMSVLDALSVQQGYTSDALARELASLFRLPYLSSAEMAHYSIDRTSLTSREAFYRRCVVLVSGGRMRIVLADPFQPGLIVWIQRLCCKHDWEPSIVSQCDLEILLERLEAATKAIAENFSPEVGADGSPESAAGVLVVSSVVPGDSPVVRLVNSALFDALKAGASDIHFETTNTGMRVKYRIDGVLELAVESNATSLASQVISRLKMLAELDIAERRVPQDGRFRVQFERRVTDLRVSIMPSVNGEDAVLRVLDKRQLVPDGQKLTIELLGFEDRDLIAIRRLASSPYGMLLVTGPTGSGKTTTLYAAISETLTGREKIVTIEDPVEYELDGVLQIPINERKGLTFARGLRSVLRHDPDTIMVGEIRDSETAEIAVQSALTGHLVLSSVHANNALDVFSRFAHMGIDPHAFASAVNGIWSQRLVRTICPSCAREHLPTDAELDALGLGRSIAHRFRLGQGCDRCRGSGYRGRRAIAEVLVLDDAIKRLIVERAPNFTIRSEAERRGMRSLRASAIALACDGVTSVSEVVRVTQSESIQ